MLKKRIYTDNELLERIFLGDTSAFEIIFNRYSAGIYTYVYRKLKDKEESRDIVQDVFVSLFKNREKANQIQNLSSYLYRSALNRVFDIFKHKYVVNDYLIERAGNDLSAFEQQGADFLVREKDFRKIIDEQIAKMPERMREVFLLKKQSYLSTKEIADKLGISELTVSTQLKRAAKIIRFGVEKFILLYFLT